jgi:hypothetical protein
MPERSRPLLDTYAPALRRLSRRAVEEAGVALKPADRSEAENLARESGITDVAEVDRRLDDLQQAERINIVQDENKE